AQPWTHDPQSEIGPDRWGEISPAFRTCGAEIDGLPGFQETGRRQSPIDLASPARAKLPRLFFFYSETAFEVENNGHTIEVPYEPGSVLYVGGEPLTLQQFHFHAPSEHTVDGRFSDMELHLVHTDALGSNAVVAVLLEVGASANPVIDEIFAHAPADEGSVDVGGVLDAGELLPGSLGYFTYAGSLTTPPCTEGVRWFVLKRSVQVSEETVALFHLLIGDFPEYDGFSRNNRPVRPRNGRVVLERR
ncbi:MAG TPA: carbonic anhydrase family protein, partial [Thermoanaerobaculia bacterium]|nr:carbonic anhydrase family protein [Thermoanaerobaculia bacterium]